MRFIDLNKQFIKSHSEKTDDGYYIFSMGEPIEVTCMKSKHDNSCIADNLSSKVIEDKFFVKYLPSNVIYFSSLLIDSESCENIVSFYIDKKSSRLYVGTKEEFGVTSGVLMFSGELSLNGYVAKHRLVYGNSKMKSTLLKRVRILSVGLRGSELFALFYLPITRGISIEDFEHKDTGISTSTLKKKTIEGQLGVSVVDWFKSAKVKEL